MKKIFAIATTLTVAAMLVGPGTAQALTAAELQAQIDALLAQLAQLQSELATLQGGSGTSPGGSCTFSRNLYPGMSGTDVKCLQQYLNGAGFTLASSGAGSPGNETEYFGPRTQGAVQKWQDANGVVYGNYPGYFGPKSRAAYDSLGPVTPPTAVCGNGSCESGETATSCPADCETGSTTPGGLTISLASDTPAASTIADAANMNFTKFTLVAGSEGDVKVSKIYVTRSGLSANADLENVKIIDAETGEYKGSIGSFNVDNRAMITFVPNLEIPAGTSKAYYIRAGVVDGTTAGKTAVLGIASDDDIVSDASDVSGAPVIGNAMSVVTLTIGSAEVGEDGTTVDSKPDVGDTDVTALRFYITAGSTEGITVETITVMKAGTTDVSDTANLELYDVSKSESLGTVDTWSSDERATWDNLNLVIAKGEKRRLKVMLDVLDNPGKTVNVDLADGSDILISVKGNTYGFYITPTDNSGATWRNTTTYRGRGYNNQTINSGTLVITKSPSSPATGNIAAGADIVLGIFDFEARGEDVKVSAARVTFTYSVGFGDGDFTNVAIYDEDGSIVAGPVDAGDTNAGYATFNDTFIVPVGTHPYTVKATIADSASNGDALYIGIDPDTYVTAKGMTSNESITPSPTSVQSCNTQTIAASTLTVTTLASPAARNIPAGIDDFLWATFSFDAGSSGEDVQVTSITTTDSGAHTATTDDIDNAELWADLTDENSSRGDIYETKISDTEQPDYSGGGGAVVTQAFTLSSTLTVPKGTFVKIAFIGDAAATNVTGYHKIYIAASGDISSTGADTGKSTSVTVNSANAQRMTMTEKGTLTVTLDVGARPESTIILDDEISTLGVFRLAADNVEDFDLDQMIVYVSNGTLVETFYFYDEDDNLLGSIVGSDSPIMVFGDGVLTIPANSHKSVSIKAKPYGIDGSLVCNDSRIQVGLYNRSAVQVTGLASGQTVTDGFKSGAEAMYLFDTRPYISKASESPSGSLSASTKTLLAVFDITAGAGDNITFDSDYDDMLVFYVEAYAADTTGLTPTGYYNLLLKMEDGSGNVLDENINAHDSYIAGNVMSNASAVFSFASNSLTIEKGETKKIKIYGDTSHFEDEGDYIRIWLDNVDEYVTWSIDGSNVLNGDNKFGHGYIIAKDEPSGNTLIAP
jgi:hypothetical protein